MSPLRSKLLFSAAALAALAAAPSDVWAAKLKVGTTIIEGPITAIDGSAGTMSVNGARVKVPTDGTTTIHTPSATNLSLSALAAAALPATSVIGAHAVVQGTSGNDPPDPTKTLTTAIDVFVDFGEAPITGEVTGRSPSFSLQDVPVTLLPAGGNVMPGHPITNLLGFQVQNDYPVHTPTTAGDLATAQGYFGTDGTLYAYDIQTTGGTPVNGTIVEVSVTKAICVAGQGKLTVLGGYHRAGFGSVAGVTVTIQGANTPSLTVWRDMATVKTLDAGTVPTQGKYKFDGTASGGCPDIVRAVVGTTVSKPDFDVTPK